jgi:hypothetical protein
MDGGYIFCGAGMFTGRTIRAEVEEVQKANVGRKCVFVLEPRGQPDFGHSG